MGAFPQFDQSVIPLEDIFSEMPSAVRSVAARGFNGLAKLPPNKRISLVKELGESVVAASDVDVLSFAKQIDVDEDNASAIITAVTVLVALATSRSESPQILIEELVKAKLVLDPDSNTALQVLQALLENGDELKKSVKLGTLANQTLPSFRSLKTSVDIRVDIKDGSIDLSTPTVVAHLQTDHSTSNVFFQLTKSDVERLVEQFSALLEKIVVAEVWSKGRKS